jgi:hypothetical protein
MIFNLVLAIVDDILDRIADSWLHIDDIMDDWWDEDDDLF